MAQHEDILILTTQTEESARADILQKKAPPTRKGAKPTKDTIVKLQQLNHHQPNSTTVKILDPEIHSLKRWVSIDEKGKFIYLYHKPSIKELKYAWVVEDNPNFKGSHIKPSKLPTYKHSIHQVPIPKTVMEHVTPQRLLTVQAQPEPLPMTATHTYHDRIDLFQRSGDNMGNGRRLGETIFNRDDAVITAKASNQAYSETPRMEGYTLSDVLDYTKTDTKIVVFKSSNALIIAFRGTKTSTNWATNANIYYAQKQGYKAHSGYCQILDTPEIWSFLENVVKATPRDRKLLLTGHSAGGALATLTRIKMANELDFFNNCFVYSYGSPMVFDKASATYYNSLYSNKTFRVYNPLDYIPYFPLSLPTMDAYSHCGTDVMITSDMFMINPNDGNDVLIGIQALCNAFISPILVKTASNITSFEKASTMGADQVVTPQGIASSAGIDFEEEESYINSLRGVRIVDKDAMRMRNAFFQMENYVKEAISREELAYRQSIGKIINYIQLRGRTVPSSAPLSRAEADYLASIAPRVRQEFEAGTRQYPSWLTALVARAKGKIPIPDGVYNALKNIARVAPYAIFAYNSYDIIVQEHSMDNYEKIITALSPSLTQSTVWDNLFNSFVSVARIVSTIVTVPFGLNFGMGAGSYIPYVPSRTPDEQATLDAFNNKLSQQVWAMEEERKKVERKKVLDALKEINSLTNGYSNGRVSTMDADVCPVINKEDVRGLIEYDVSLQKTDCGVVATILV